MCGICGTFRFHETVVERALIESMCARLVHRGPDAEGVVTADHIGLGQRRLAIIDLDPRSVAPLTNEDSTVWVTFNGEIYNYRELRSWLCARGHRFQTESDTEVLVHLYEEQGTDCVHALRGMFAFAIWDSRTRQLFAARDRLGKKPFYYARTATGLSFASEVRALLQDPAVHATPDYAAIDLYLRFQYVPSPFTAFVEIRKLPAAHTLTCDLAGTVSVGRYWRPPAPAKLTAASEEIEEEVVARLREAVRLRLVADVPLGALLSGGIDSAAVVALMAQEADAPVRTFTMGLEESDDDERTFARLVADRYGTEHHEFVVQPDAAALLPLLVRHYGEPFGDSSALPTYALSQQVRPHVAVVLSGDGGDESFGGYDAYGSIARWGRADVIPRPLRAAIAGGVHAVTDAAPYGNWSARAARAASMLSGDTSDRYWLHMTTFKEEERQAAYTREFRGRIGEGYERAVAEAWTVSSDRLDWMMRQDQIGYLPDCLMVKVDIASMANSLEVRSPFLDHEFMTFVASIPSRLKRNGGPGKLILRNALRDLLPQPVLRKRKTGFGIPVAHWFRTDLRELVRSQLLDDRALARGLFNPAFIRRMIDEHQHGLRDWSNRLWALLCLELWFREFVD